MFKVLGWFTLLSSALDLLVLLTGLAKSEPVGHRIGSGIRFIAIAFFAGWALFR